ncbi:MAG: low temperature requirement protein A [Hyphomicrobiales bacterium]
MSAFAASASHLRVRRGGEHTRVTFIELFFDLVFVFAVTQLSHGLLTHLTPLGALQTLLLMVAVWWAWIDTAWITNWLDPDKAPVRLLLFALMLGGLVLSAAIPKAFEDRALAVALAYVLMQAARNLFMLWALRHHDRGNFRNFLRITIWHVSLAPLWLGGCFVDGADRLLLWALAVGAETIAPMFYFWVPWLGRSTTTDWAVEGAHMAERCGLFVIIALGESILITGATVADLAWTAENVTAFVVAFVGSVAMWAVYFNIGAERSSRMIAASDDPGRIARSGYTYLHILIVAGIIVAAVGDEMVLHHPSGHAGARELAVLLGGPALYLTGNALFKRLSAPYLPLSHLVGLGLLVLLIPAAAVTTPLGIAAGVAIVLIVVASWEWWSLRTGQAPRPAKRKSRRSNARP